MKTTKSFSIGFWLKKTAIKSDGQIPIYARIRVDGKSADISVKRTTDQVQNLGFYHFKNII
ncbi:hypothetical protein BWZ22_04220 [Seonamhaeicola sp. S2-3]|uniref:Arm DNA-binding domain-containing protein n=1 Tax=Seonamhaeicola sp. S2-3 TaxID=1936081 RepID=UPI00097271AC|nr:Arm DNA-binding domain-containing protein [Seonamhaeicola sp. S2-3]APY10494.1 hypothetical protein BWZ22_04220 [Seonamhaeicola sp. S2-3]